MTRFAILSWAVLMFGACMPSQSNAIDKVKAGTVAHPDRVFAHVTQWFVAGDTARIRMSDDSEWILAGEERLHRHASLLDLSRDNKKALLLAVDKTTRQVGMVFSTMTGVPEFYGETADGRWLQVSVPPSTRVFRLPKNRPWFDEVMAAITHASEMADSPNPPQWWIAFDSETGEVVDVRPVSSGRETRAPRRAGSWAPTPITRQGDNHG